MYIINYYQLKLLDNYIYNGNVRTDVIDYMINNVQIDISKLFLDFSKIESPINIFDLFNAVTVNTQSENIEYFINIMKQ